MSYGLVGLGDIQKDQAKAGFRSLAQQENQRNQANEQIERGKKAQKASTISTAAGMGLSVGLGSAAMGAKFGAFAGPIGMVGGAAIGLLANSLFD